MSFFVFLTVILQKEMRDTLQVTREGTTEVNRGRINTLAPEYELFRMKLEENIKDMENILFIM